MRETSVLTDYVVICSGTSTAHLRALWKHIDEELKAIGRQANNVEGTPASQWIIIDYGSVIVHLFDADRRQFYNLEELLEYEVSRPDMSGEEKTPIVASNSEE